MNSYKHRQIGYWLLYGLIICALLIFAVDMTFVRRPIGFVTPAVLLLGAALFSSMTITIDNGILRARFGPGPAWKKVRLSDVAACEPTRIRWWYGWGVHLTPRGWLYNVSGWDAVEITLRDGRRFLLGTDEPAALKEAILRSASAK